MEDPDMEKDKFYTLPVLPYEYSALKPVMSEEQLKLHHQKHHQAYVNGANAIYERLDKVRKENTDIDMKATLKELSFHIGGFELHSLFWQILAPAGKGGGGVPKGAFADAIKAEFGSFDRFKKEFTQTATSVEGSGWAALIYCKRCNRLLVMQIEKHNVNVYAGFAVIMVLDVWEHAYYLDYKNDRAKFVDGFWNIVNWDAIGKRFEKFM
jgi:Fe-Mn family superoxide dismutase